MGTTLTGKRVQNTYDSLLKLSDNDNLTSTAKIIGDGLGNDSPIYLSTTQIGIGVTPSFQFHVDSHAKIGGNLIVGGNLTVNGTTTHVDSTIVEIGDNMIELAAENVSNTKDIGWYGTINSSGEKYVGVFYDASSGVTVPTFRIGLGTVEPDSTAAWTVKGKVVIGALDATSGVFSSNVDIDGYLQVDGAIKDSDGDAGTSGQVLSSTGTGTNWVDFEADTAKRLEVDVKNVFGATMTKGTVVHAQPTGTLSGNVIEVVKADANVSANMPAIGILNEDLSNNAEGKAVMFGTVQGIDTSSFSVGDELYVSTTAGEFTATKPTATTELVQKIAVVVKSHASNGLIKVFGAGRSNDVPNEVDRDLSIAGTLKVDDEIQVEADSGYGRLEVGGPDGGYIDLKTPFSDDYDLRIITNSSGSEFTGSGDFNINAGNTLTLTLDGTTQSATFAGDVIISSTYPRINLTDTNHNDDWSIINADGTFRVYNVTDAVNSFDINSGNVATFAGNVNISKSVGDAVLTIEADTDNNNENDNPRIELKQDAAQIYTHLGINGDADNTFTGAIANYGYLRSNLGLQVVTGATGLALTISNSQNVTFAGKLILPSSHTKQKIEVYGGGNEWIGTSTATLELSGAAINLNGAAGTGASILKNAGTSILDNNNNLYANSFRPIGNTNGLEIYGYGGSNIMIQGVSGATYYRESGSSTLCSTHQSGYIILATGLAYGAVNAYTKIIDGSTGAITGTSATFSGDVRPTTDSTSDLGTTSIRWANVWTDNINGGTPVNTANDLVFDRAATRKIIFNSDTNFGSDKAFLYFNENSSFHRTGTENVRFSIGAFNDFSNSTAHSDAVDVQGGSRLYLNAGDWDTELDSAIGTPATGAYLDSYPIQFAVNNDQKIRIGSGGDLNVKSATYSNYLNIGTYTSNHINSSTLPDVPSEHMINISPPSTTNYYGGGISWSEGTNTAASLGVFDDGGTGALGFYVATGNNSGLTKAFEIDSTQNAELYGPLRITTSNLDGVIEGYDSNHSIVLRENNSNVSSYYQYGGTLAQGRGHKFYTGGVKASQSLRFHIADDGAIFTGDLTVSGGDITLGTDSIASNINAVGDVLGINVDSNTGGGAGANIQLKTAGTTQLTINSSSATFTGDVIVNGNNVRSKIFESHVGHPYLDSDGSSHYIKGGGSSSTGVLFGIYGSFRSIGHIYPHTDSTYDLGSTSLYWRNLYVDNIVSDGGNSNALKVYRGTATISNTAYTTIATVNGDNLASAIRLGVTGTSGNVVINVVAEILVNHSTDILIKAQSGYYTRLKIKIVSDNNEDFAIELQRVDNTGNTTVAFEITPLGNEAITLTSSHSISGSTLEHVCERGESRSSNDTAGYKYDSRFEDGAKIRLGDSSDLQLYHDGSNSYINENGTGSLITQASDYFLRVGGTNNTNNAMVVANSGTVTLYYANSAKFETTSNGAVVSDYLGVKDVVAVGDNDYNGGMFARVSNTSYDGNWGFNIQRTSGVDDYNVRMQFYPNSGTTRKLGLYNARGNNWILYADGSVSSNCDVKIPNGNLMIGSTGTPNHRLDVNGNINIPGGNKIVFNNEPNAWFLQARTSTSTPLMSTNLKNLLYCGGGASEGFSVGGTGTGDPSFEVSNDGYSRIKTALGISMNPLTDGGELYINNGQTALNQGHPATSGSTQNAITRVFAGYGTYGEVLDTGFNVSSSPYAWIQATNHTALNVNYNLILNPNGGSVGIGTGQTAPDEKLTITGGYLKFNGGDYGLKGSASLSYNAVSDHYFQSSGSTKVTFKANGNVGIGLTTGINQKLTVNGSVSVPNANSIYFAGPNDANWRIGRNIHTYSTYIVSGNSMDIMAHGGSNQGFTVGPNISGATASLEIKHGTGTSHQTRITGNINFNGSTIISNRKFRSEGGYSLEGGGYNTSYTSDGLFGSTATPNQLHFSSGRRVLLGYSDNGSGLYAETMAIETHSTDGLGNTVEKNGFLIKNINSGSWVFQVTNLGQVTCDSRVRIATTRTDEALNINGHIKGVSSSGYLHMFYNDPYHGMTLRGYPTSNTSTSMTAADVMSFMEYGGDFRFYKKNASVLTLQGRLSNGTWTVTDDIVAFGSPSDIRLKENIKPIKSALDKVDKLKGVTFDWKENEDDLTNIKHDYGFIAQDVEKVIPELVRTKEDGMKSLRYQGITPILLEAIKELKTEIQELKSEIKELKK